MSIIWVDSCKDLDLRRKMFYLAFHSMHNNIATKLNEPSDQGRPTCVCMCVGGVKGHEEMVISIKMFVGAPSPSSSPSSKIGYLFLRNFE